VRLNYKRNTVDVDDAINQLKLQKPPIKAVVMVSTYRAAAKFIERTHDLFPEMIYTNVSFVGSTALANELMLLGPRYASGVIVTQVVPAFPATRPWCSNTRMRSPNIFPAKHQITGRSRATLRPTF
jgi:branched-chain amino acid transport system substrate-binding protein